MAMTTHDDDYQQAYLAGYDHGYTSLVRDRKAVVFCLGIAIGMLITHFVLPLLG